MLRTALSKRVERRSSLWKRGVSCRSPDEALRAQSGFSVASPGLRRRAAPSGLLASGFQEVTINRREQYKGYSMNDLTVRDLILQHVPQDGSSVGNKTLLQQINAAEGSIVPDADFLRIRDELIAGGVLANGKGRGGSVFRVLPAENEAILPVNDEDEADEAFLAMQEIPEATPAKPPAASKPKAGGPRANKGDAKQVISYRHDDKRKNNPQVGMVDTTSDGVEEKKRWAYDPHIDPILNFDTARAGIENLIDEALASNDPDIMRGALEQLKRMQTPYLNWTGKAERTSFDVDTVSLSLIHI